jgi:hypothetical protein
MNRILQVALVAAALAVIPAIPHVAAASDGEGYLFLPIDHHDLEVKLDTDKHRLKGLDRMSFAVEGRAAYTFYLGGMFEVEKARLNGGRIKLERIEIDYPEEGDEAEGEHPENRVIYRLPLVNPGEYILEVEYGGVVYDTLKVPEGSRSGIPSETIGLIDAGGSYLGGYSTGWYPDGDDFSRFSIRVTTPPGIESVTEGKLASVVRGEKNTVTAWEVGYPTQHVTLMAADYIVREREVGGVTLMAYFFASEEELIDTYLDATEEYIELYNGLIGPYPFSKFAVVENFFPTGYGMPSYTLLGRRIVRMPFIVRTSLGHEVVHNWWGNCVYPDYDAGNWCEGLATYYADYRYESEKGDSAAVAYRRDITIDYATHVTDATDMPLVDFQSRGDDEVAGVVGYGKCLMVFHMLNNEVGDDKFYRAMRTFYRQYRFEVAVWEDIESAFEEAHGSPLDRFFRQWVYRAGAPRLSLDEVSLEEPEDDDGRYTRDRRRLRPVACPGGDRWARRHPPPDRTRFRQIDRVRLADGRAAGPRRGRSRPRRVSQVERRRNPGDDQPGAGGGDFGCGSSVRRVSREDRDVPRAGRPVGRLGRDDSRGRYRGHHRRFIEGWGVHTGGRRRERSVQKAGAARVRIAGQRRDRH